MAGLLKVSVVMSVFDKPLDVVRTIESVLSQQGVDLDLVVVNDGASQQVVAELGRFTDSRLRVIHQENQGLTKALIRGCEEARHGFIARIDAGDIMLAQRLHKQAAYLDNNPPVALVSCWVVAHTDEGFPLYQIQHTAGELAMGIRTTSKGEFRSPVHTAVMFRKSSYDNAGGYREQFYFAQDCDLWARLVRSSNEIGVIEEVLQRIVFSASGISGRYRGLQKELANIVVRANQLRANGGSDEPLLLEAQKLRPLPQGKCDNESSESDQFEGNYFIASVLSKSQPGNALIYWRKALKARPWSLGSRLKAVWCQLRMMPRLD